MQNIKVNRFILWCSNDKYGWVDEGFRPISIIILSGFLVVIKKYHPIKFGRTICCTQTSKSRDFSRFIIISLYLGVKKFVGVYPPQVNSRLDSRFFSRFCFN